MFCPEQSLLVTERDADGHYDAYLYEMLAVKHAHSGNRKFDPGWERLHSAGKFQVSAGNEWVIAPRALQTKTVACAEV